MLVIQSDSLNASRIQTVTVATITGNRRLAEGPRNVVLATRASGLGKESVANVSQVMTIDCTLLLQYVSTIPSQKMAGIDEWLRLALSL